MKHGHAHIKVREVQEVGSFLKESTERALLISGTVSKSVDVTTIAVIVDESFGVFLKSVRRERCGGRPLN